jgi:hypothetical protein
MPTVKITGTNTFEKCISNSVDSTLRSGSSNLITSGAVHKCIVNEEKVNALADVGYSKNTRISDDGTAVEWAGIDFTGFIPCKADDVVYLENIIVPEEWENNYWGHYVGAYDSDKNFIKLTFLSYVASGPSTQLDKVYENGNLVQFTVSGSVFGENVAFIRLSVEEITDESVVNINGESVDTYVWDKAISNAVPKNVSQLANDRGYLTSVPAEYVTEAELAAKKYLTAVPSEYITDSELNAKGYLTMSTLPKYDGGVS